MISHSILILRYFVYLKGQINGTCFHYYSYIFPWIKSALGSWLPSILGICLNLVIANGLYAASRARQSIVTESMPLKSLKNRLSSAPLVGLNQSTKILAPNNEENLTNRVANNAIVVSTTSHSKERQITIMLMAISISFMVLSFPYSAFELLRKFNVNFKFLKNRELFRFILLLMDITHATNFVLYCMTGQKFRKELKLTVLGWFRHFEHEKYKHNISQATSIKRFD